MTLLMAVMTSALAWAQDPIVTGFAATSGTAGTDENENYAKLVDGDRTTKWCITQFSGCYIEFEANEAFVPSAYILTTGNDNADSRRHGRNPKNWVLKAKTNKHDSWVTIASVTGDNVLQDVNTTDYEFPIANSGIYRYFRLEVSAVKSGSTFQLGELRFRGHSPKESELVGVTLDETIQYITDVKLIGGSQNEVNSLANTYTQNGWLVNEQNLNEGAGGDVIYLLYKMGSVASANQSFITDIYLTTVSKSEDTPGSLDYGDWHYTLASYDGSSNFKKYKGNLNNGVSGGDQIHLYYTTDYYNDFKAISSIIFNRTQSGAVGKNGSTTGYNLNNKGHLIYMHCPRNYAPLWKIEKSTDGGRCIIKGFNGLSDGVKKSAIKAFPSILCGAQVVDYSINPSQFSNLKTVYFNENLKTPEMISLSGCKNLQHVHTVDNSGKVIRSDELPFCITSIPNGGFSGCTNLTSLTIPGSVTSIGELAFNGCTGLTSLIIPNSVTSIGELAFNGCSNLTSLTIMDGVTSIGGEAFSGCTGLTKITIPSSVTSIGQGAFQNCTGLTSVTIMDGVKSIGELAFNGCSNLTSLTIPGSVTSIENTFKGNTFLTSVTIMDGASIGQGAFQNCTGLTTVAIMDGVTNIGGEAFSGCTGLTKITIPGSVTNIGEKAFNKCSALKSVTIENGVKSIGQFAFQDCTSLTSITIPSSVESIGYNAFWACTSLKSATIENGVKSIGQEAFRDCTDLTGITIPGSVESIGYKAFWACTSLKSVTIENGVKSIGQEALRGCTSLTSITIPGSVESIGQGAFWGCTGLTSVTIENGVESIGQDAFYGCTGLTNITIPGSVGSIGQGAFWDCEKLESVSIMGNPKIDKDAFPDGATVTLSLTANAANGAKWMTFYNDRYNFQADENTTVYKATVSGQSLVLTEVADKIVNGAEWSWDKITAPGTAVILKSTGNPVMTRTMAKSSDTQANALLGTMEATATPANTYTLASGSKGVGFYRYTGSKVAAGKAYIIHNGASAAREFFGFDESGEATGISTIPAPAAQEGKGCAWYDLYGRKLQGDPAKKGIYMRNDRKVVIK